MKGGMDGWKMGRCREGWLEGQKGWDREGEKEGGMSGWADECIERWVEEQMEKQ